MRFDYYASTIRERAEVILAGLQADLSGLIFNVDRQKGPHGYESSDVCVDPFGDRVCAVWHGGVTGSHGTHVVVSGGHSPVVAEVLRRRWPGHAVSRADVAVDFDGSECWEKLLAVCDQVARDSGLKWTTWGDFREDRDELSGRTVYVGSRQSAVMVRLYEKGKQVLPTVRVGEAPPSLNWCRLEVEVKPPNRAARVAASSWSIQQFWGSSAWSCRLLRLASNTDVERVTMTVRKETDARRSVRHMAVQYQQPMQTVISEEGGDMAALMRFIAEVWDELARMTKAS